MRFEPEIIPNTIPDGNGLLTRLAITCFNEPFFEAEYLELYQAYTAVGETDSSRYHEAQLRDSVTPLEHHSTICVEAFKGGTHNWAPVREKDRIYFALQ